MTVLVACNASPHGEAALRTGVAEAVRRGLPLAVLVLNPQSDSASAPPPPLREVLEQVPAEVRLAPVTYRKDEEEPADAILDAADATGAALVVIGARKRSSLGTFLMGTTTQRVLLDASVPVLVVKDAYDG